VHNKKKFAWIIGIVLASLMFIFLVIVNAYSPITGHHLFDMFDIPFF
jgi:hypothetical protein